MRQAPNGDVLKNILTETELDNDWRYSKDEGFVFYGDRVAMKFTGRTERECRTILDQAKTRSTATTTQQIKQVLQAC
jgi:hypothetical protein